jgi:hypothetical protein
VRSQAWVARCSFRAKAGDRWWPVLGSIYAVTAVKRVQGLRLVGPIRKRREELRPVLVPVSVAQLAGQRAPTRAPQVVRDAVRLVVLQAENAVAARRAGGADKGKGDATDEPLGDAGQG